MDSSDPDIVFDVIGQCNHCTQSLVNRKVLLNQISNYPLSDLMSQIKTSESGKKYDGIIGVSGGVDSSYLIHVLSKFKLRLLLVHVDAGWNSAIAVFNIHKLVSSLNLDLETVVIDWDAMRDLQIAFLKSGVLNQDVPQDHAFFATLYNFALKNDIRYIFTGTNTATESMGVKAWAQYAMDGRNLKAIYKKFGDKRTIQFPIFSIPKYYFHRYIARSIEVVTPLNHATYNKSNALAELRECYDWEDYGGKHRESMFTTFYQDVYMVERYAIDKRIVHLSDLIMNGEISREDAMSILGQPASTNIERQNLIDYVSSKLDISTNELESYLTTPMRSHLDLKNDMWFLDAIERTFTFRKILKRFLPRL